MLPVDEEALADGLERRRERGAFFTPAEIVDRVLMLVGPLLAEFEGPVRIIDPACGAGAFLSAAARRWPEAELLGIDLEPASLRRCAERVPRARLIEGNALTLELPSDARVNVWLGNPPYNGTSSLLRDPAALRAARRWLPDDVTLPKGTSLRDDFVFFLLRASKWLEGRRGVLAFVTSSTLLDAFQHAPIREALLRRLSLRHVVDLGAGVFRGTRVRTCITVWSTQPSARPALFEGHGPISPRPPERALRPVSDDAEALDAQWRAEGTELTTLVPLSVPGLKTRFDELLVDDDEHRLLARLREFVRCSGSPAALEAFARDYELPERTWPKLRALHGAVSEIDARKVRRFHRHRGAPGYCYLERALIPRGDHRLRGDYDPHAERVKLVFNINELPLYAKVIDDPGCVTAYRHSRFAPLMVPQLALSCGRPRSPLGAMVPNFSLPVSDPRLAFERIAAFVNSEPVQKHWAPAFGMRRILCVPKTVLEQALQR